MTATAESLLNQALALPEGEREEIAERLWQSMPWDEAEGSGTDELTEEQKAMLDRRWEEIESGKVQCQPVSELLAKLRNELSA